MIYIEDKVITKTSPKGWFIIVMKNVAKRFIRFVIARNVAKRNDEAISKQT